MPVINNVIKQRKKSDSGMSSLANDIECLNTGDDTDDEAPAFVTTKEGEKAYETFKTYLEQYGLDYEHVRSLKRTFNAINTREHFVQPSIDNYLS